MRNTGDKAFETEYTFGKFNKFCEDTDIEHQLIAPYTPRYNKVVERKK